MNIRSVSLALLSLFLFGCDTAPKPLGGAVSIPAVGSISGESISFPDENLQKCFDERITQNGWKTAEDVEQLICVRRGITDSSNLEQLPWLKDLELKGNSLTTIDLSKNTALKLLYLDGNQLTTIDLSKNTALEFINLVDNQLTAIDLSRNTALEGLFLDGNQLTTIDLSKNVSLINLFMDGNQLTTIDLSNNYVLIQAQVSDNPLTEATINSLKKLFVK